MAEVYMKIRLGLCNRNVGHYFNTFIIYTGKSCLNYQIIVLKT